MAELTAGSIPNSLTSFRLVETATMCLATASCPSSAVSQVRTWGGATRRGGSGVAQGLSTGNSSGVGRPPGCPEQATSRGRCQEAGKVWALDSEAHKRSSGALLAHPAPPEHPAGQAGAGSGSPCVRSAWFPWW